MLESKEVESASNPSLNEFNLHTSAIASVSKSFSKDQSSNVSSPDAAATAAAVAVLRSQPTVSVADVPTNRMIRRTISVSTHGSSILGSRGPKTQRRMSSGSMSERSFRDRSPRRSQTTINSSATPIFPMMSPRNRLRWTRASADPTELLSSKNAERGLEPLTQSSGVQRTSGIPGKLGLNRQASRESINFSLPTGSRSASPVGKGRLPSPSTMDPPRIVTPNNLSLTYDPSTRKFISDVNPTSLELRKDTDVKNVGNRVSRNQAIGTHLECRPAQGKPMSTTTDTTEDSEVQPLQPIRLPTMPEEPRIAASSNILDPATDFWSASNRKKKPNHADNSSQLIPKSSKFSASDSNTLTSLAAINTQPSLPATKKRTILEQNKELSPLLADAQDLSFPESGTNQNQIESSPCLLYSHGKMARDLALISDNYEKHLKAGFETDLGNEDLARVSMLGNPSLLSVKESDGVIRESGSTVCSVCFTGSPEDMIIKHNSPPRPITARKSALKHSGSSSQRNPPTFESSYDKSEVLTPNINLSTRKSNRVNFGETKVVHDEAASKISDPPAVVKSAIRRLLSSKEKTKVGSLIMNDDKMIKPRPEIPAFEHVRETKSIPRSKGCRLVEHNDIVLCTSSPASHRGESIEDPTVLYNNNIMENVNTKDLVPNDSANISNFRVALPQEVKSVTDNDLISDESEKSNGNGINTIQSFTNNKGNMTLSSKPQAENVCIPMANPETDLSDLIQTPQKRLTKGVFNSWENPATINAQKKMPLIPGAWENLTEILTESSSSSDPGMSNDCALEAKVLGEFEYDTVPLTVDTNIKRYERIEESEAESIYSNAVEDFSDFEDDRLTLLDAVVDDSIAMPIPSGTNPTLNISYSIDSPASDPTKHNIFAKRQLESTTTEYNSNNACENLEGPNTKKENIPRSRLKEEVLLQSDCAQVPRLLQYPAEKSDTVHCGLEVCSDCPHSIKPCVRVEPNFPLGDAPEAMPSDCIGTDHGLSQAEEPRISLQMTSGISSLSTAHTNPTVTSNYLENNPVGIDADHGTTSHGRMQLTRLSSKESLESASSFRQANLLKKPLKLRRSMRGLGKLRPNKGPPVIARSRRSSLRSHSPLSSAFSPPFSTSSNSPQFQLSKVDKQKSVSSPSSKIFSSLGFKGFSTEENSASKLSTRFVNCGDDGRDTLPALTARLKNNVNAGEGFLQRPVEERTEDSRVVDGNESVQNKDPINLSGPNIDLPSHEGPKLKSIFRTQNARTSHDLGSKKYKQSRSSNSLKKRSEFKGKGPVSTVDRMGKSYPENKPKNSRFWGFASKGKMPETDATGRELSATNSRRKSGTDNPTAWPFPERVPECSHDADKTHHSTENILSISRNLESLTKSPLAQESSSSDPSCMNNHQNASDALTSPDRRKKKRFGAIRKIFRLDVL